MTHSSDLQTPVADAAPAPRPYEAPELTTLGAIEALTAGPDDAGAIDMIVGDDGGFVRDDPS